mmetsp:Transcript_92057/g.173523  ORF Transcript_92057/g.173523 Transcript_92057/m.173523 type:complete len:335 (-) Transcript_92057:99-1103(-)
MPRLSVLLFFFTCEAREVRVEQRSAHLRNDDIVGVHPRWAQKDVSGATYALNAFAKLLLLAVEAPGPSACFQASSPSMNGGVNPVAPFRSSPSMKGRVNPAAPFRVSRRDALGLALSTFAVVTPVPALGITGTRYHKSKPELGVVLLEEPREKSNVISADVVLDKGVKATVAFQSAWPRSKSDNVDLETAKKTGESAFLQIQALKEDETLAAVPKTWFSKALFTVQGRFGAYGEPTEVKLKELKMEGPGRSFELSFNVLTTGGNELPRKGVMRALQAPGSPDVLMLTCSSDGTRWGNEKPDVQATAASFQIVGTQSTALKRDSSVDYRYVKSQI